MRTGRQRSLRYRLGVAAVTSIVAGTVAVVSVTAAHAVAGCGVTYQITNQWAGGFGASVAVTNFGDPVTGWRLTWSFPAGQTITQLWNGTVSQAGAAVTVTSAAWNGALATGQSATLGFNGAWNNTANPVPDQFALNGVTCTGGTANPSTSPSSASPSTSPSSASPSASPSRSGPSPSVTPSESEPPDTDNATIIPDPSWTCGMADGIVPPARGQLVLTMTLRQSTVRDVGVTQYGNRRVAVVDGGTFTGTRATGSVLSGGLDLDLTLSNGSVQTEQLHMLRTGDGTLVYLRTCGVASAGASAVRIVPDFEAPNTSSYAWLNTGRFVGTRVVNPAARTIELSIYDVSAVSSTGPTIQLRNPTGGPNQSWDCATATGTRGATVFTESVTLGSSLSVGASKRGTRNVIPITGGTMSGRVTGSVLPGGADYQLVGATSRLDARYVLLSDDGETILVRNCGPFGNLVPTFETRAAGSKAFLNTNTYLSSDPGVSSGGVSITFYERR